MCTICLIWNFISNMYTHNFYIEIFKSNTLIRVPAFWIWLSLKPSMLIGEYILPISNLQIHTATDSIIMDLALFYGPRVTFSYSILTRNESNDCRDISSNFSLKLKLWRPFQVLMYQVLLNKLTTSGKKSSNPISWTWHQVISFTVYARIIPKRNLQIQ